MELKSNTHKITLDEASGEFQVWPLEDRQLHVTEFRGGVKVRDEIETQPDAATIALLEYTNSVPLFAANWSGDGYNVDLDCGFQRWTGTKSEAEVRTALRRCGLGLKDAKAVLTAAKIQEHSWIRRY